MINNLQIIYVEPISILLLYLYYCHTYTMKITNLPKTLGKLLIRIYQKLLSPDQSYWGRRLGLKVCIHEPYCSEYTYQAIDRFGLIKGSYLGFRRILRCRPGAKGGHDPVPETK